MLSKLPLLVLSIVWWLQAVGRKEGFLAATRCPVHRQAWLSHRIRQEKTADPPIHGSVDFFLFSIVVEMHVNLARVADLVPSFITLLLFVGSKSAVNIYMG